MSISDFLVIIAIIIAPLFAVHVQRQLESAREKRGRKLSIFKTLMATRAETVSKEHVEALNMIDLEFHDRQYRAVTDAWKIYLDHLFSYPRDKKELEPQWEEKRFDCLTNLLMEMGKALGYDFDEVHVKKGVYAPTAHSQLENENILIRGGLIRLLYGEKTLKMDLNSVPVSEKEANEQAAVRKALIEVLEGRQPIRFDASVPGKTEENK